MPSVLGAARLLPFRQQPFPKRGERGQVQAIRPIAQVVALVDRHRRAAGALQRSIRQFLLHQQLRHQADAEPVQCGLYQRGVLSEAGSCDSLYFGHPMLRRPLPPGGRLKYDRTDARDVLERASARETVARVACGAVCKKLLREFSIEVGSYVAELGGVVAARRSPLPAPINDAADQSPVRCLDKDAEAEMIRRIDAAKAAGDTLGGIVEVVALGVPVGLGSHVSWDTKLDGRLAQALMSIPAVKGVELGLGFEAARRKGSEVHDEIMPGFARATNRAGGTEGGMTTGEPLVVRVAMKPISTLMSPLKTVDLKTGGPAQAQSERSDVTAVPAMGVIAEAMVAIVITGALLEKFGGDALSELKRNVDGYLAQVRSRTEPHVPPLRILERGPGGEAS